MRFVTVEDVLQSVQNVVQFSDRPIRSLEDRGFGGDTPLIVAAIWGESDPVRLLLDAGADVNAAGEDHDTPLHRAIMAEAPDVIELLISRGANVDAKDDFGRTPRALLSESLDERIRGLIERMGGPAGDDDASA